MFACSLDAIEKTLSVEGSKVWHFIALGVWIAQFWHCFLEICSGESSTVQQKPHMNVVSEELCLCIGNS